jgi:ribose-phosphate pyrophosphokinase
MSVNLANVFTSTRKPETPRPKIIFSTPNYSYLVDRMVAESSDSLTKGETEHKLFPDGEIYNRFITDVYMKDVVLVGGTDTAHNLMQLFYLASGLVESGCHYLWIIIPFYGYSTMERAVKSGEVITAKCNAKMLSSISKPGSGAEFILLDLHVETICGFFEDGWRAVHLQCRPIILEMITICIKETSSGLCTVLGSTDAGRAKHIEALAGDLSIEPFVLLKHRSESGQTKVTATSMGSGNSIEGKNVIVYDDMIRTGGSLIGACHAYYAAGATSISVITTHGVFAGDAVAKLKNNFKADGTRLINSIWMTDSHPNSIIVAQENQDFIRLFSVANILSYYLNTH